MFRKHIFIAGAIAAVAVAGYGSAAYATDSFTLTASTAAAPVTIGSGTYQYECVNKTGQVQWIEMSDPGHPCAGGLRLIRVAQNAVPGPQGPAGANGSNGSNGTNGANGTSYQPVTASAAIAVTNDPDTAAVSEPLSYSNGGIWALDSDTFTINLTRHGAADLSKCSNAPAGNATCYYYTGTESVAGTFTTLGGATVSPLGGKAMTGVVTGTINGVSDIEFYASSGNLSAAGEPVTVDNTGEKFAAGSSDVAWYKGFFPAGTALTAVNQPDYSFTYLAASEHCTSPQTQETMTQAFNGNKGDITGTCAA